MPHSTALDQFAGAGAVITRCRLGSPLVEDGKLAAAVAADRDPLQQRGSLAHRALTGGVCDRAGIRPDSGLVGLPGGPVDEPVVVIRDEHLPLVSWEPAAPLMHGPGLDGIVVAPRPNRAWRAKSNTAGEGRR